MEERKTAAIVLGILAVIIIIFTIVIPKIKFKSTQTLSYNNCTIHFRYARETDTSDDGYIAGQDKLGLCLCSVYDKRHDTTISKKIMELYRKYGSPVTLDTNKKADYNNLDSVLKYKHKAFDTVIMED